MARRGLGRLGPVACAEVGRRQQISKAGSNALLLSALILTIFCAAALTAGPAAAAPPGKIKVVSFEADRAYLSFGNPLPTECPEIHVWSPCGSFNINVTLTGFDAFGGISTCSYYPPDCVDVPAGSHPELGGLVTGENAGGSARITLSYRCESGGPIKEYRSSTYPRTLWMQGTSVNYYSRIDSNTARISAAFIFPTPDVYSSCLPGETRFAGGTGKPCRGRIPRSRRASRT